MTWVDALLVTQAIASGAMCGIIWFVQIVHYPLFGAISGTRSADYAREHQRRTPLLVVPLMLLEGLTAALLAAAPPAAIGRPAALAGVALIALIWLSTALVQMPQHARLGRQGHDPTAVATLVRGNWPRTLLWTARALLAGWMLHAASWVAAVTAPQAPRSPVDRRFEELGPGVRPKRFTPAPVHES